MSQVESKDMALAVVNAVIVGRPTGTVGEISQPYIRTESRRPGGPENGSSTTSGSRLLGGRNKYGVPRFLSFH